LDLAIVMEGNHPMGGKGSAAQGDNAVYAGGRGTRIAAPENVLRRKQGNAKLENLKSGGGGGGCSAGVSHQQRRGSHNGLE